MEKKLPGDYIAGFVDGEGCFALKFRKLVRRERKRSPTYYYWSAEFVIVLDKKDKALLERIRDTINCGTVKVNARGAARLSLQDIWGLKRTIIPFFDKYSLRGIKRFDYELWKEAVNILDKNKRKKVNIEKGKFGFQKTNWDANDLKRLIAIQKEMRKYKGGQKKGWKWIEKAPTS